MKRIYRHFAFTLVELIVVLAIILALSALIFPVFARAQENARRTTCRSNLRQIGIAISLYRQDYDGMDPQKGLPLTHSQLGLPYHTSMSVFLKQYVKNREVLFCPSYRGDRSQGVGSSYGWAMVASELLDPSYDYEQLAAMRGPDYPMVVCNDHHDRELPRVERKSNEVNIYHVLRLDGRVDIRKAVVTDHLDLHNW